MAESTGWSDEYATFTLDELGLSSRNERQRAPEALVDWLKDHPQDILFFNRCLAAEPALPYLPSITRSCYVVHDTAPMFWKGAVEHEDSLDHIVAVSETVAGRFREGLTDSSNLSVVHNGTLLPDPPDATTPRSNDLVFLGGAKPKKGAYDLLELWPALVQRNFRGHLHWFGDLDSTFEQRVANLPASDRIHTYGFVPRSAIFEQSAQSKVLLMLSRVEPFGMATIEGMGMGCLPVAWDIETGTSEIIEPGRTGFTAPLGDIEALADSVLTACTEHDEHAGEAMRVARERFSEKAMWRRYEALIDRLQSSSPVDRPLAGQPPPTYTPPTRLFQLLPDAMRNWIREQIGRSAKLGYYLQDLRGR
jgi:glycosyltransferase involved in cell wall biosynthesis